MRKLLASVAAVLLLAASPPPAPHLPVPEGWRTEVIPFPLDFAHSFRGVEHLRFAPGFMKADSENSWSYVFVWVVERGPAFTRERLTADLTTYFDGLARAVEKKEAYDPVKAAAKVTLEVAPATTAGRTAFRGTLAVWDGFTRHGTVTLNAQLEVFECAAEKKAVVLFRGSPQPASHPIWKSLDALAAGFTCTP